MGKDKRPERLSDAIDRQRVEKLAEGVEAHEYKVSFTGMYCGAMVMRDGSGAECGLPYGHSLHIDPRADRVRLDPKLEKLAHDAKEPHEYQNPTNGLCGLCGYGPNVSRHREATEAPVPLAEIQERTFEHEADAARNAGMGAVLNAIIDSLYLKARQSDYTPVDTTVTVEVTLAAELSGAALKPSRPHVRATVRAWKAVAL